MEKRLLTKSSGLIAMVSASLFFSSQTMAQDNWARYKEIRTGVSESAVVEPEENPVVADEKKRAAKKVNKPIQPQLSPVPPSKSVPSQAYALYDSLSPPVIECPETPDASPRSGRFQWFLCHLDIDNNPVYTPYGIDFPFSYVVPADLSPEKPARLLVYLHPYDSGAGSYVTGASSFHFLNNTVELHNAEQNYKTSSGGWWVYSGNGVGKPGNYNGNQIAASIDYLIKKYGDGIAIEKGIHFKGKSLGGAGVMHQAMVLPKYQDKIAVVDAVIARMMMPKTQRKDMTRLWGAALLDSADVRKQWHKIVDIHFNWRGGSNDSLGTFDREFLDICELRKISCSAVWLKSGHGLTEKGYSLNTDLWLDENQDVTLDKVLPVITNNSSNYHSVDRGYHNRGISWNHAELSDTPEAITISLKYLAQKNIGPELPDQPDTVTFSITPRHIKHFQFRGVGSFNWRFGEQSGKVQIGADGLITIDGLQLTSGAGYKTLRIE